MQFKDYANYYNLLYRDKNYKEEVEYINSLVKQSGIEPHSLIDLGCGTGQHLFEFEKLGFEVTGMDLSEEMIAIAKLEATNRASSAKFYSGDIRTFTIDSKFQVVISLFHVMSYQTSNDDLERAFRTAKELLSPEGLFIFDCWYGPAVLTDRPTVRIKNLENEAIRVKRSSIPSLDLNRNVVNVEFNVHIENKNSLEINEVNEMHMMRYLFYPEIEKLAKEYGFSINLFHGWLNHDIPTEKDWYVVFVLRNE